MNEAVGLLTKARQAVWRALDDWPALRGVFKRTWRFEDVAAIEIEPTPSMGELPAIAIFPADSNAADWVVNQSRLVPYRLQVTLWTRQGSLLAGERLWEEITRALFQSGPEGGPGHVFAGVGRNDVELGGLTVNRGRLADNGPACLIWRWTIELKIPWNPAIA